MSGGERERPEKSGGQSAQMGDDLCGEEGEKGESLMNEKPRLAVVQEDRGTQSHTSI